MFLMEVRNVQEALVRGLDMLRSSGRRETSRAGDVLVMPAPVMTVYRYPCERTLSCPVRDANPFFHLFESLWILAGRNDATWLDRYVSDFSARFAEDDGIQHAAYGHRWRIHFGFDQIETCIDKLRRDSGSRQAVLQMWDPAEDLVGVWRDIPCNTTVYLRLRTNERDQLTLDMTVSCRSNDAVWGAHGANAVHFSMLQEYLALRLGARVGLYYQLSNNYHVYTNVLDKMRDVTNTHTYEKLVVQRTPLAPSPAHVDLFDSDLREFMRHGERGKFESVFFCDTVVRMARAHRLFSRGRPVEARDELRGLGDWLTAGREWIERRIA